MKRWWEICRIFAIKIALSATFVLTFVLSMIVPVEYHLALGLASTGANIIWIWEL